MLDKKGFSAWDRPRQGGRWLLGFLVCLVGWVAAVGFAALLGLDRDPQTGFLTEVLVGFGVIAVLGCCASLIRLIGSRARIDHPPAPGDYGVPAPKPSVNVLAQSLGGIITVESSSEFDAESFRSPSRVMTIDQALAKASLAWREGKHAKAEGLVKSAIAELEGAWSLGADSRKDTGHERRLASALATLAGFCVEQGRDVEAEPLLCRFLELGDRVLGPDHPKVAQALVSLEGLYKRIGATDRAETIRTRRELLRIQTADSSEARVTLSRAGALFLQGKYAEASTLAQRALTLRESEPNQGEVGINPYLALMGRIESSLGDFDAAEGHFLHALALVQKIKHPDHSDHAERGTILWNLGQVYRRQGRYLPAEPLLTQALAIREETGGPNSPETAECLSELALLHAGKREWDKADPCRKRAIAAWETAIRSRPRPASVGPSYAAFLESFVTILRQNDRDSEADALAVRARAVRSGMS